MKMMLNLRQIPKCCLGQQATFAGHGPLWEDNKSYDSKSYATSLQNKHLYVIRTFYIISESTELQPLTLAYKLFIWDTTKVLVIQRIHLSSFGIANCGFLIQLKTVYCFTDI